MVRTRLLELLAIALIGEGISWFLTPRSYARLWAFGPRPYRQWMERLAGHPGPVRLLCTAEVGLGIWLARHATARR